MSFKRTATKLGMYRSQTSISEVRRQEVLLKTGALQNAILNSANFSIIATDETGIIQLFNVGAERMLGYLADEVVNKINPSDIHDPHEVTARAEALSRELGTAIAPGFEALAFKASRGIEDIYELTYICKSGARFPAIVSITALRDNEESLIGYLLIGTDNSARKHVEIELQLAKEAADTANRAKSTFLATMSHEIRTPMYGVLGMLELLAMSDLDAKQRTTVEIIRESGASLQRIIDDILDYSRIEANRLEICTEIASVKSVVKNVLGIYSGNASNKGLLLKSMVDDQISPALWLDPLRLQQILNNFVSNSIKFTSIGSVEVAAKLISRADGKEVVSFSVRDTGIGISEEGQKRLFEPFMQAEAVTTKSYGGTGLGLSICNRLAEMMGGAISMESAIGIGTTMKLILTMDVAEATSLPMEDSDPLPSQFAPSVTCRLAPTVLEAEIENTLVLVVDDHPVNRIILMRQVNTLGYAAESAVDGVEALELWRGGRFALVVTDCNMPNMNGYELAHDIRQIEVEIGRPRTPMIACTANAQGGESDLCIDAGMDDYIAKPVELMELLSKLTRWLPIPEVASALASPSVDIEVLLAIAGHDEAGRRELITMFCRINDEDARLLRVAVRSNDVLQVRNISHRMKGACKVVGAFAFASVCERIEFASQVKDWEAIDSSMARFDHELIRMEHFFESQ